MADFGVGLEKEKTLKEQMSRLGIKEGDIVETFIRSGGPGGQNVNKVATCVYLRHIPTGLKVKCSQERSQVLNRYLVRKFLLKKIENLILGNLSQERQGIEKIRRQKRKRSKKAKLKILEAKHRQSEKKFLRQGIRQIELD